MTGFRESGMCGMLRMGILQARRKRRRRVDLPEPEGPVMRMIWPGESWASFVLGRMDEVCWIDLVRPNHWETRVLCDVASIAWERNFQCCILCIFVGVMVCLVAGIARLRVLWQMHSFPLFVARLV